MVLAYVVSPVFPLVLSDLIGVSVRVFSTVLCVTACAPTHYQPLDNLLDRVVWTLGVVYADTTCEIRVLHSVCSFITTRGRIQPTSLDSQIIMFTLLEVLSICGSLCPSLRIAAAKSSGLASYLGHHNCGLILAF